MPVLYDSILTVMLERRWTPRLELQRLDESHRADFHRLHADAETMATLAGVRSTQQSEAMLQAALEHWQRYGFGIWMLYDRDGGEFVGRGGLKHTPVEGEDSVEVLYALLPKAWGRGLALELAVESVRVAFTEIQLGELTCFTLPTNLRSRRVMEKAGFVYEHDFLHAGLPHILCRLRREDWLRDQIRSPIK